MKHLVSFCFMLGFSAVSVTASATGTIDAYANSTTLSNDYVKGFEDGQASCKQNPALCGIAMPEIPSIWMTPTFGLPGIRGLRMLSYTAVFKIPLAKVKAAPGAAPFCFKDIYMAALPGTGWWGFVPFSLQPTVCPQAEMPDLTGLDQLIAPLQ